MIGVENHSIAVIPSRWGSTRFPGKPLAMIAGKTMIRRVYDNVSRSKKLTKVIVATDDTRIAEEVESFGGRFMMTSPDIANGTERVAAAVEKYDAEIVINVQGDEPLVPYELIDDLIETMSDPDINICTPVTRIVSTEDLTDPNQARVIFDKRGDALYFTRATVPFNRDESDAGNWLKKSEYWKHVGIYCFRRDFLFRFIEMPMSRLEAVENLEQLRILENGYPIRCVKTEYHPFGVDVPEDIERIEKLLAMD